MSSKVALIIIDGWGLSTSGEGNAITSAQTPLFDQLFADYPAVGLKASGPAVGLPENGAGNSEAGHRAIGTGQVTDMMITRLRQEITSGEIWRRPALAEAWQNAKANNKKIHLVGLLSDATNHSCIELLYALVDAGKQFGYVNSLYLHLFLDGRDTQMRGGQPLLEKLYVYLQNQGYGSIATLCGRRYGMSRGGQDDLAAQAAALMVERKGQTARSPLEAVMDEYGRGAMDADLTPTVCDPNGAIEPGDSVIFFNHRADRQRPLLAALGASLTGCYVVSTIPYLNPWPYRALYEPAVIEPNLCSLASSAGKHVTKITESDRYAHLTTFFNGGAEGPYYNEERVFVDSPHLKVTPEQSLAKVSQAVQTRLRQAAEDLLVVNIPNLDAAGHTGDLALTIEAVQAVDKTLADWIVAGANQWLFIFTSDHGNAEYMKDPRTNEARPEDTASLVPGLFVAPNLKGRGGSTYDQLAAQPAVGMLTDVTATALIALGLPIPPELSGVNLLEQMG